MKLEINLTKKQLIFILTLIALTFFRIYIGDLLGAWFPYSTFDDELMLNYADLSSHFSNYNHLSLVKSMSFPLFLNFVDFTGLSYVICCSIIWLISSLTTVKLLHYFNKNIYFLGCAYIFILYTPVAFDLSAGTRMYRNAIIAPFVLIVFDLILINIVKIIKEKHHSKLSLIVINLFLGFFFTFTYYIKEDGIWLLVCLLFSFLVLNIYLVFNHIKKITTLKQLLTSIIIITLPLIMFYTGTHIYKTINLKYFGVYEIETRNDGEIGEFVSNIYKINSPNRTAIVWAPADAIVAAFEASETLSQHPQLLDNILHTPWFNQDIYTTPIHGDFLTWVLRDALGVSGLWQSEKQVDDFFKQVNIELDDAFNSQLLIEDDKIQLLSSAGGYSTSEIIELVNDMIQQYKSHILLQGYNVNITTTDVPDTKSYELADSYLNMSFRSPETPEISQRKVQKQTLGVNIANIIFNIYKVINPCLMLLAIVSLILTLLKQINLILKKQRTCLNELILLTSSIVMLGITIVFSFGIAWFSYFLNSIDALKFYSVGMIPLLVLVQLFGCLLSSNFISTYYIVHKKSI